MPRVGCFQPFLAGDAVQHAEDDGVRPHKGPDLPDGLVQGGGFHRHQDQVHRLAVRRVAVSKAAFFPVAEGGLGGIPGRPRFVRDHLHPGHLPPEQDAQRPQPDQRAGADGPAFLQGAAGQQDGVPFLDVLGGQAGVRHQKRHRAVCAFRAGQARQLHLAEDRRALRQFFAAIVGLADPADPVQFHPAALPI